ncbi:hypothetical protein JMJ77_0005901 [Colletotrichum scovillei]|uniref:Uncharacterized protein n=1 Tax=Colletotrichum scovillei TaxID=1209932 RepID=A0A9P7UJ63_9PEZI|nr:hypothetical protein JMJ77_0005901 [Colletotrichum scovillei]KAG7077129.1 hypothetical protein JMJ76_0014381 [Colletotrichum scovillei]KAG7084242.1 hypothetical protein JMJ78_0009680 [Colletotrichum scovillei]
MVQRARVSGLGSSRAARVTGPDLLHMSLCLL